MFSLFGIIKQSSFSLCCLLLSRAGPVPKQRVTSNFHSDWQPLGFVSHWGGMEIGSHMMYPDQVVDGIVHRLGGRELARKCAQIIAHLHTDRLQLGMSVVTGCNGIQDLENIYDFIIHTTPPFYHRENHDSCLDLLKQCYTSSLNQVEVLYDAQQRNKSNPQSTSWLWDTMVGWMDDNSKGVHGSSRGLGNSKTLRVAIPLMGAGCRGFQSYLAMNVAATESVAWMLNLKLVQSTRRRDDDDDDDDIQECIVAFAIPDPQLADLLVLEIQKTIQNQTYS